MCLRSDSLHVDGSALALTLHIMCGRPRLQEKVLEEGYAIIGATVSRRVPLSSTARQVSCVVVLPRAAPPAASTCQHLGPHIHYLNSQ